MPTLKTLFDEFPLQIVAGSPDETFVTGITLDSRAVQPGYLFVAIRGASADGHDYIAKAIASGAAAIVGERWIEDLHVPYIRVANPRQALTWLSAAFYNWPGRKL